MATTGSGHRCWPHTADLRIEAWAPTREGCIAEAVVGTVVVPGHPAVLDELIYLMDTTGDVPIDAELEPVEEGVDVRFAMVDAATVPQIGALPKAVTLHELRLA